MDNKDAYLQHLSLSASKQQLRDLVMDTAIAMFKQKGIKGVTMDEISSSLGISKRTVYELFEDKETLLVSGMVRGRDKSRMRFESQQDKNATVLDLALAYYKEVIEEHKSINPQFYDDLGKYPKALKLIEQFRQEDRQRAHNFFKRGVDEGMFRGDINYEVLDLVVSADMKPLVENQAFRQFGFEQVFGNVMIILLRGIATHEGLVRIDDFVGRHVGLMSEA